jgi:hypothetical protein
MEQLNQNQNITRIENEFCEIISNEISMEEEPLTKALEENPIHEKMQVNLEKLHAQRLFWRFCNRFTLYVGFFYYVNNCVNANNKMDGKVPQVIFCILCYNNSIDAFSMIKTQVWKGIIGHITKPIE